MCTLMMAGVSTYWLKIRGAEANYQLQIDRFVFALRESAEMQTNRCLTVLETLNN